ncbi:MULTISPECIES: TetR/AcrR family transcriptional regulator [unclassified Microbacterium]|uniref:TetR/AcrR family transcriptional regulator n=1 Tax=unclassified Microbacterium TaxID=2609290 RepID=UPI00365505AA
MAGAKRPSDRRDQLILATLDAIRDRGIANLRIQDVAARAGVATGTVHYHFNDLDQLINDVYAWACDRFYTTRLNALAGVEDAREQLALMIDAGVPESEHDALVIAMHDIDLYRRGNATMGLLLQALYERQVALYFATLQLGVAQGHFRLSGPVVDLAQNLVALEDAYELHIISGNRSAAPERARELILGYARTVTGCTDLSLRR